jgi:hypothetical protein
VEVSKAENNEQIDADIQQAKKDVLRARDIIPCVPKRDRPDSPPLPTAEQKQIEVPSFDLAEEIMANQRKITAIKRKAPGKKTAVEKVRQQAERLGHTIEPPMPASPEEDRIIAEIVARDIDRLCRGATLGSVK